MTMTNGRNFWMRFQTTKEHKSLQGFVTWEERRAQGATREIRTFRFCRKRAPIWIWRNFKKVFVYKMSHHFCFMTQAREDPKRLCLFSSEDTLKEIQRATEFYVDGTFKIVPLIFLQLFTIHLFIFGQQFPVIYGLLTDKSEETYVRMFQCIISCLQVRGLNFSYYVTFIGDFQSGIISSIRLVFYWYYVRIGGCYFHFAQCIYRKVVELNAQMIMCRILMASKMLLGC